MISIKLDKDLIIKNMLSRTQYLAYMKYKEGILSDKTDQEAVEISKNIYALIAYKILRKALYYTPVDTGRLRNSSYIKPYAKGFEIGYTCEYAIYVHEIGVNHHAYPTQYKYLEDAAFEVLKEYEEETGIELNITIEYDPLRIFVGVEDSPGESLTGVKYNEQLVNDQYTYQKLLQDFNDFDYDTASDADRLYFTKLTKFIQYYENYRHMSTMPILREWIDRQRHN